MSDSILTKLRAGVAKCDITTDAKDALIRDRLYSKVLVLDDGCTQVVIIAMDVTAIGGRKISQNMLPDVSDEFLLNLRSRIERELQIPGRNVLVNASHTHPPGKMLCDDDEQVTRTFDAVKRAVQNMVPVKIGTGFGYEDRITVNRTLRLKNGKHWTLRHSNPSPLDAEVEGLGPIDPQIGIIRIDRVDGSPLAVVYNFGCHLLFGDAKGSITANLPGIASKIIEENLNGAMALFLQGAGGDVIDILFKDFNRPRDIEPLGSTLGLSVLRAAKEIQTGTASLGMISETIRLPRRKDIPMRIGILRDQQAELLQALRFTTLNFKAFLSLYIKYSIDSNHPFDQAYRYYHTQKTSFEDIDGMDKINRGNLKKYLGNVEAMEKLARIQDDIKTLEKHQSINAEAGEPTISTEIQVIKIGDDCIIITSAAELLVEIGLNLKKSSPYKHTFIAAYSNGYLHYGAPASYYDKESYEVTECLLAAEWQQIYETKVNELICKL